MTGSKGGQAHTYMEERGGRTMTKDNVEMEEETGQQMEDINSEPFNLKIYRFPRVIFGVSAQPISSKCHHAVPYRETYRYQQTISKHLLYSIYVISGAIGLSTFIE